MTSTIVDSVVLIDVFLNDRQWADWSNEAILKSAHEGRLVINPIIYAEVAPSFEREEELEAALPKSKFNREDLPYTAGFLAGMAHYKYRRSGGTRERTLPDFFVGAHAQVRNYRILTRDARRYRLHFPEVEVIAPETHP